MNNITVRPVAVITGATSGIGAAYAEKCAELGYDLLITGRREDLLNESAARLTEKYGVQMTAVTAELSDGTAVKNLLQKISECGTVDMLINNAGFGYNSRIGEGDPETFDRMIAVHAAVPLKLIQQVLPGMKAENRGYIINVASDGAFLLIPENGVYAATKRFLVTLTEVLHLELAGTGIRVQAVCPGLTKTDFQIRMGMSRERAARIRWADPADVVEYSFRKLKAGKVVVFPKRSSRILVRITGFLPRGLYYRLMSGLSRLLRSFTSAAK